MLHTIKIKWRNITPSFTTIDEAMLEPNMIIEWQFMCENSCIYIGMYFLEKGLLTKRAKMF